MADEMLIEMLMKFGLTRQESAIYLCLCLSGALTGYEAAKQTGISRSNVYSALAGLVEKGAADLSEGASVKYIPLPIEEFTENHLQALAKLRLDIIKNAPKPIENREGYITIEGYAHILDKVRHMCESIESRVYFSAKEEVLLLFAEQLAQVVQQKKKCVVITDDFTLLHKNLGELLSEEELQNILTYKADQKDTQLRLIIDSKYVLTGEITGAKADTALYSAQPNFVNVFKEAMHNEMKLIELTGGKEHE